MAQEDTLIFNFFLFVFIIFITTWNNSNLYDTFANKPAKKPVQQSMYQDNKPVKKPVEKFEAPINYNTKSLYEDQVTNLPMKRYGEKAREQELLPQGYDKEHFAGF